MPVNLVMDNENHHSMGVQEIISKYSNCDIPMKEFMNNKLEHVSLHFGKPKRMTMDDDETGLPLHMMVSTLIKRDSVSPENSQYTIVGQPSELINQAASEIKNSQFMVGSRSQCQSFNKNKWPYQRSSFGSLLQQMEDKTKQMYKSLCGTTGISDKVRITRKMVVPTEVSGMSCAERNFTQLYGTGRRRQESDNESMSGREFEFSPKVEDRENESLSSRSSSHSYSPPLPLREVHNSPHYNIPTNEELFMHSYQRPRMYTENQTKSTKGMTSFKFQPVVTDGITRDDSQEFSIGDMDNSYKKQISGLSSDPLYDDWEEQEHSQHSQEIQKIPSDESNTFNMWSPDYYNSTTGDKSMNAYEDIGDNTPLKYSDCYDDFML